MKAQDKSDQPIYVDKVHGVKLGRLKELNHFIFTVGIILMMGMAALPASGGADNSLPCLEACADGTDAMIFCFVDAQASIGNIPGGAGGVPWVPDYMVLSDMLYGNLADSPPSERGGTINVVPLPKKDYDNIIKEDVGKARWALIQSEDCQKIVGNYGTCANPLLTLDAMYQKGNIRFQPDHAALTDANGMAIMLCKPEYSICREDGLMILGGGYMFSNGVTLGGQYYVFAGSENQMTSPELRALIVLHELRHACGLLHVPGSIPVFNMELMDACGLHPPDK